MDKEPYRRVPQVLLHGNWKMPFGLQFGIDSELVNFDRDVGATGWRANVSPKVDLTIAGPGWFVTPAIEFAYTSYELKDTQPGVDDTPERSVPISSLDMGLILERAFVNSNRIQTIEPRLLYVNIPFRNQNGLPVFDTISRTSTSYSCIARIDTLVLTASVTPSNSALASHREYSTSQAAGN